MAPNTAQSGYQSRVCTAISIGEKSKETKKKKVSKKSMCIEYVCVQSV